MKRHIVPSVLLLSLVSPAAIGAAAAPDTASCAACHTGSLSLQDHSSDELAAALAAMAAGERAHPTDLRGLDEAQILEIVAALQP